MKLTVARIGRAHGLRGEVALDLRTDVPEERFVPGAQLDSDSSQHPVLTVVRARSQNGRWFVAFQELADRTAAENARGIELTIEAEASDEDDAWYIHELVGLTAVDASGQKLGTVTGLENAPAQDLLVVKQAGGFEARIPFIEAFVPEVDIEAGRIVLTPPYGLLAGEEPENAGA